MYQPISLSLQGALLCLDSKWVPGMEGQTREEVAKISASLTFLFSDLKSFNCICSKPLKELWS